MSLDTEVLVIGAGPSGIGIGVQLIRQYGLRNFQIIEKLNDVGGTWFANTYPGCGCDVPSHFYSYSFALKPDWSQVYAMQPEIRAYFRSVADQYDIPAHVKFNSQVVTAEWDEATATWLVLIENTKTRKTYHQRCKVLVSAVGLLSVPKKCDIPGAERFQGRLFHSAEWDHTFNWAAKKVVTIGNGCSATQFVPVISEGKNAVEKITQFSRQPHWLSERPNPEYSSLSKWTMRWIPFAMRLYRAMLYWRQEKMFSGFHVLQGQNERETWAAEATQYIRKNAPAKYVEALIPKTVIGCKRRVNDTDYLACLHRENVELVYDDPIAKIIETGVKTKSGRVVNADAIVLATGFETQKVLHPLDIRGEKGVTLAEHWDKMSEGSPSAYFGTCLSRFPNFFMMMGPNTVTGHLSVIYTVECQINFTMRVIQPIIQSMHSSQTLLPRIKSSLDKVVVTERAERFDNDWLQRKAKELVWSTGCTSWFIHPKTGRNTQMYPDWQYKFWARSIRIMWSDFNCSKSAARKAEETKKGKPWTLPPVGSMTAVACFAAISAVLNSSPARAFLQDRFTNYSVLPNLISYWKLQ